MTRSQENDTVKFECSKDDTLWDLEDAFSNFQDVAQVSKTYLNLKLIRIQFCSRLEAEIESLGSFLIQDRFQSVTTQHKKYIAN